MTIAFSRGESVRTDHSHHDPKQVQRAVAGYRWLTIASMCIVAAITLACGSTQTRSEVQPSGQSSSASNEENRAVVANYTEQLTAPERHLFQTLTHELLSPCSEPTLLDRCMEQNLCSRCGSAARYLARLVTEGYERTEIEERYRGRFSDSNVLSIDLEGAPARGAEEPAVTVVEFSDFECPFCGRTRPILEELLARHGDRVRLVFRNFPLSAHPNAHLAARAATAAGKQNKFWEMHDELFAHQANLSEGTIEALAENLALDMARFHRDLESSEVTARVDADRQLGEGLGVRGTPSLFVNGRRFDEPISSLSTYIEEELGN